MEGRKGKSSRERERSEGQHVRELRDRNVGGGGLECGIKIDQNVSVKTIEQEWNGKHKRESDGK